MVVVVVVDVVVVAAAALCGGDSHRHYCCLSLSIASLNDFFSEIKMLVLEVLKVLEEVL